jgi:catechol 2,3-dioxygenase-like lactoylglutathione lyase family enzyme
MNITAINHVCLVVRDESKARPFYQQVLGFARHQTMESWLIHKDSSVCLHLVEVPEAEADASWFHKIQHVAFQVDNLQTALRDFIHAGVAPFQMDFQGAEKQILSAEDDLGFGIGTIFVTDPDGNLLEFIQLGRGIYQ